MGEVYEAVQVSLGRRVALKTIREDLTERADLLGRFRREAESAAALGHPNLVQVTDFQQNAGEPPFLVMEMLDGTTLKEVLEASNRIEPARASFIGIQLLSGLAAAHRAGIIHRDVKPGNIFLQSTTAMRDIVKVLDFGVAKLAIESAPPGATAMTRVGEVLGTLSYMAPEQGAFGGSIDPRTDIYAVGATLFHALAGLRPFEATEPSGVRSPLSKIAPWVHPGLAAVVERALERLPEGRWPSADAMATALQPFASAAAAAPGASVAAAAPAGGGWDPSAIGRLDAPTGGSSYGTSPPVHSSFGSSSYGLPPTAPTAHGPGQAFVNAPTAIGGDPRYPPRETREPSHARDRSADASRSGPPMVSGAAPVGAVPYHMPSAPPVPMGPPLYAPQPMMPMPPFAAQPAQKPWWILAVVVVVVLMVLGVAIPVVTSLLAVRRATDPSSIATTVDREILKQTRPPCPAPDACTLSREANGLTYPLCTRRASQSNAFKPGDFVLGNTGSEQHLGVITSDLTGRQYAIRFMTAQKDAAISESEIQGLLCTPRR